jgi:glycosyltransferase involved in cell wall biosynthesis
MQRLTLPLLPPASPSRTGWPWTAERAQLPDTMPDGLPWPRVSIVTPSYNQQPFLEETIRSLLLQEYPDLQYIIMDGGSNDGTVDILRRYESWLHWVSEPDRGQADAINKGLRMATGAILAYLNSDDIYLPGAIRTATTYLHAHPEVGMVYGDCRVIDAQGRVLGLMPGPEFDLYRYIHRAEVIPQQATFWRREALERVGAFDAGLHYSMDYDFFIRVGRAFPVAHIPQPLACFRLHGASKTVSRESLHWRESLAVSERYGMKPWTAWYWMRRLRHWGLRALPEPLERRVRRRMSRPWDPYITDGR